ncbi:MAG TPA: polysaccharide deacetylase family protein [Chitinophagaceae bacterium]|nr:polysaccharide deacetylase family protein [Chitinophagaceae bacterium]
MYLIKPPSLLKQLYPADLEWKRESTDTVYLTFDDGPHPIATPFVLDELKKYHAKGTFFCIGKNVVERPDIYTRLLLEGHSAGNHTQTHLNGWKAGTAEYLDNIADAATHIDSKLFRPPYGKIKRKQANAIIGKGYRIIMWDVLSGDFDTGISPEKCWENVALHLTPGSIVVFHDSSKAWERLHYALPRTLAFCKQHNWKMEAL